VSRESSIFTETTRVEAGKSINEIITLLVQAGASAINLDFANGGQPTGLRWLMRVDGTDRLFAMPARVDRVDALLYKKWSGRGSRSELRQRAERIAWRQLYWWTKAQLALIGTSMVEPAEVFAPFAVLPSGETLGQVLIGKSGQKLLQAP
jgi:hypothetical protein